METVAQNIIDKMDLLKNSLTVNGYSFIDLKKDFVLPAQKIEGFWRLSIQYSVLLQKTN